MKIDINFDELLNESVNAAIDATVSCSDHNPDSASTSEQLQRIVIMSANTTISILQKYHSALENALSSVLDNSDTTH